MKDVQFYLIYNKMADQKTASKAQKLPKEKYILKRDVPMRKGILKKGKTIELTEKGRKYFKSLNRI